jgi:hypothetical protein
MCPLYVYVLNMYILYVYILYMYILYMPYHIGLMRLRTRGTASTATPSLSLSLSASPASPLARILLSARVARRRDGFHSWLAMRNEGCANGRVQAAGISTASRAALLRTESAGWTASTAPSKQLLGLDFCCESGA